MTLMWVITIGFIIILGLLGALFIFFLRNGLNNQDAYQIDEFPEEEENVVDMLRKLKFQDSEESTEDKKL